MKNGKLWKFGGGGTLISDSQTTDLSEEKYERCICCKAQLNILKITPIDKRECYIQGTGQLCPDCYRELAQTENGMTDEEMKHLARSLRL